MIEQLKNCPQCGGVLNEAGRCEFCGSKVYDFLSIDFGCKRNSMSAKTYIRIRANNQIMLAPIIVSNVGITMSSDPHEFPNIDVSFVVVGDMILLEKEDKNGT